MSTTKKFLKHIREGAEASLPTHPSDAATEIPDTLDGKTGARAVKPELDGTKSGHVAKSTKAEAVDAPVVEGAEEDLPTHPSDAAAQIPDKLSEEDCAKDDSEESEDTKHHMESADISLSEEDEDKLSDEEDKDMKESVTALTSEESLPESFKEKVASIFEAAVKRTAKKRVEAHKTKLVESYNQKIADSAKQISEALVDKVDGYLDYVVEEWMKQNEVAIESSLRSELTEKFISGLKNLFESHYIEIPAEKADVVHAQESKIASLEKELNEEFAKCVELRKENSLLRKDAIVKKHTEGMTVSEAAKFSELCEGVSYDSATTFSQKLKVIKETYFPKSPKCSGDLDASLLIEGGLAHEEPTPAKSEVDIYAETISRMVKR
jgi:hypothetical protein